MLQDLDSLAARIGQMVQFTRQLQAERSTLQARLKSLEQERQALREKLQTREQEYSAVTEQLTHYESRSQSLQSETQARVELLEEQLARYKDECDTAARQLADSRADADRLRLAAGKAMESIDSILVRLPGAPQE